VGRIELFFWPDFPDTEKLGCRSFKNWLFLYVAAFLILVVSHVPTALPGLQK
jgi:hypothetical protein